ncbi:MAG: carbamoyl-phosphate synthase large subunit, partial [Ruminiclostridium sp.]
ISKVTGIPIVKLATQVIIGNTIKGLGYTPGLQKKADYIAIKMPVFSFEKIRGADISLGPEMKSTGECLGIAHTFSEALYKGLIAAGFKMFDKGGVLISVRNQDKPEIIELASRFEKLGFDIYATSGTASTLIRNMIATNFTYRVNEGQEPNIISLLESGKINYVISTSETGRKPARESVKLRRKSVERSIACLTSVDTANALVSCIEMKKSIDDIEMVDITKI